MTDAHLHINGRTVEGIIELAALYKERVDAGCDMSRYGRSLGLRLLLIAEGKLLPKPISMLAAPLDTVIARIATLPKDVQQKLWDDGLPVLRDNGKVETVALRDLSAAEVRRAIEVVKEGKKR
jgi:hypothetical protein